MAGVTELKTHLERAQKALRLRPAMGRGTATTTAALRSGKLTCDIEDGGWKLVADESPGDGGDGQGPDPGVFGRAALGSCLAIGYGMWAAYMDIPIDSVEVIVEADYDASGLYGVDDSVPARWSAMRYTTRISSPAPEEAVREMVAYADSHSSLLNAFRDAIPVTGDLQITAVAAG
jgi:uncharacterized OsmC-like protein